MLQWQHDLIQVKFSNEPIHPNAAQATPPRAHRPPHETTSSAPLPLAEGERSRSEQSAIAQRQAVLFDPSVARCDSAAICLQPVGGGSFEGIVDGRCAHALQATRAAHRHQVGPRSPLHHPADGPPPLKGRIFARLAPYGSNESSFNVHTVLGGGGGLGFP